RTIPAIRSTPMATSTGSRCCARVDVSCTLIIRRTKPGAGHAATARMPRQLRTSTTKPRSLPVHPRTCCCSARATGPSSLPGRRPTASCCAAAGRSTPPCPTIANSTILWRPEMDLAAFRAALGDIPVQDHPRIVQQKSRDHYWYSPRLKAELENVTAQLVVAPRTQEEVRTILAAAYKHSVPVTPRGAGTGNYGQAMPLSGGVILELTGLDRIVSISRDRVRAEAGIILEKLDAETKAAVHGEMRFHPSTYRMAT